LLAEDHLAVAGRLDGDLRVAVARRADVDDVDVLAPDDLAPVRGGFLPAALLGRRLDVLRGAAAEDLHPGRMLRVEEPGDLTVRVAVRPSHEGIANQRNIQWCCHTPRVTDRSRLFQGKEGRLPPLGMRTDQRVR